jgi:hypothetical protein
MNELIRPREPPAALEGTMRVTLEGDFACDLTSVHVPTLVVIAGVRDELFTVDLLRATTVEPIPGARLAIVHCGHETHSSDHANSPRSSTRFSPAGPPDRSDERRGRFLRTARSRRFRQWRNETHGKAAASEPAKLEHSGAANRTRLAVEPAVEQIWSVKVSATACCRLVQRLRRT